MRLPIVILIVAHLSFRLSRYTRADCRRFVDSLATRLGELEELSRKAKRFHVFNSAEYSEFRRVFGNFRELTEEFQMLSEITEKSLDQFKRGETGDDNKEHQNLGDYFLRMQVPMLHGVISTNLSLLKVWDDRLQRGEDLPLGAYELFVETLRVIFNARQELIRPCYADLLDQKAIKEADRVERLLRALMRRAPKLLDFMSAGDAPVWLSEPD